MRTTWEEESSIIKDGWNELAEESVGMTLNINNNNNLTMSKKTKKYLISSLITFLTGVALVLLSNWDGITLLSFKDGTIVGIVFVAIRAGFKALIEYLLTLNS